MTSTALAENSFNRKALANDTDDEHVKELAETRLAAED